MAKNGNDFDEVEIGFKQRTTTDRTDLTTMKLSPSKFLVD